MVEEFTKHIKSWLIIVILINVFFLCYSLNTGGNSVLFATVAKNIVTSGNWINLMVDGQDWLDKPHFPFWITAASFKLFGIHSFSYILPGMLFNLLGAYFTYRIGRFFYNSSTGLLAALIYLTALQTVQSCFDIKAEAYLVGEIMPACYYWLRYDAEAKIKYLVLGAFFTALAMMTKGLFVLVTIMGGLFCSWIYKKEWRNFVSLKWWSALVLSLVFTLPELISLYLQFDAHPEKVVYGQTGVSGIAWFFWGSQFGRFFNNGFITGNSKPFFFYYTFLWAFLPWSFIFIFGLFQKIKTYYRSTPINKTRFIYLFGSFALTFALFSASKFQHEFYISIIFPFAAIICANTLSDLWQEKKWLNRILLMQLLLGQLFLLIVIGLNANALLNSHSSEIFGQSVMVLLVLMILFMLAAFVTFSLNTVTFIKRAIICPIFAIQCFFITQTLLVYSANNHHHTIIGKPWINATPFFPSNFEE